MPDESLFRAVFYSPFHVFWFALAASISFFGIQTWDLVRDVSPLKAATACALLGGEVVAMSTQAFNPFLDLPILRRRFRIAATGDAGSGTSGNPSSLRGSKRPRQRTTFELGRPAAMLLTVFFIGLMVTPSVQELVDYSNSSLLGSFNKDAARFGVQIALQEVERHVIYDSKFANTYGVHTIRSRAHIWDKARQMF